MNDMEKIAAALDGAQRLIPELVAEIERLRAALNHIIDRLQMDIDDGGRPDQWSMEDLVRTARAALEVMRGDK